MLQDKICSSAFVLSFFNTLSTFISPETAHLDTSGIKGYGFSARRNRFFSLLTLLNDPVAYLLSTGAQTYQCNINNVICSGGKYTY